MSGCGQHANVTSCEGFRMLARARRFDGAEGPAFENLHGPIAGCYSRRTVQQLRRSSMRPGAFRDLLAGV